MAKKNVEQMLHEAHCTPRQIEEKCNVPMYRTSIANNAVGPFGGSLVVSMRPYRPDAMKPIRW